MKEEKEIDIDAAISCMDHLIAQRRAGAQGMAGAKVDLFAA